MSTDEIKEHRELLVKKLDQIIDLYAADKKEYALRAKRFRWALTALAVLMFGVAWFGITAYHNGQDLTSTTKALQETNRRQEVIRGQVLCPMYKIFLGSYDPSTRKPGPDRDKYETAFAQMGAQYRLLNCEGELVPPRADDESGPR